MNVHTHLQDAILYASVHGERDFDSYRRILEQVANEAAQQGVSKILLDLKHLDGDLTPIERINLAVKGLDDITKLRINPIVAVVGATAKRLAVIAAQSLGADVEMFPSIEKAIEWLNRSPANLWR